MTIKHLAHQVAHDFLGGIAGLADFLGLNKQVLTNKLNFNSDSHHLYIQEFEKIADFTNTNLTVADYFAAKCNAVVVVLPEISAMGDMALLDGFMAVMRELGDLSAEFQQAYADGNITDKEFKRITLEVNAVIAKLLAWQSSIKQVVR